MSNYNIFVPDIKQNIDCVELFRMFGFEVSRSGYACCPFHSEKTGSCKVWHDHFKCFGCGASGDVISFTQRVCDVDFAEAIRRLNALFELHLPLDERVKLSDIRASKTLRHENERKKRKAEKIAGQYRELLNCWISFDILVREHPVPDNKFIAWCYRNREHIAFLLDNFDFEEGGEIEFVF